MIAPNDMTDLEAAVKELIAKDAVKVPPYPGVAMKLQQLISGGNYGTTDIVKIVSGDQVLAATALRCANSAAFRGTSKITALPEAVARIGTAEIVKIALATSLGVEASKTGALAELRRQAWHESLTGAFVCHQLAHARKMNGQEGFVCGLLHDFGRIVAIGALEQILAQKKDGRSLPASEWLAFVDRFHVELGLVVAAKWGLSELLQAVISSHHNPAMAGVHRAMVDVIIAADAVVALLESRPDVTMVDLSSISGLSTAETALILAAIPQLAPYLASLDEAAQKPPATEPKSQIEKPTTTLKEPVKDGTFPVKILRSSGEAPGQCLRVSWAGFAFSLKEKLPTNYLVRLKLEPPDSGAFEVHGHIMGVKPTGATFETECRLFALDGPAKEAWCRLMNQLGVTGGSAAMAS